MSDDKFSVAESAALLRAIFPNYPNLQGSKAAPQVEEFLRTLRSGTQELAQSAGTPMRQSASSIR